jgi:hypothetical protein
MARTSAGAEPETITCLLSLNLPRVSHQVTCILLNGESTQLGSQQHRRAFSILEETDNVTA